MKDDYTRHLENIIKKLLDPLQNVPFNLVIEAISGYQVIPFNENSSYDKRLLSKLKTVATKAGRKINLNGIISRRPNEVGNYIEPFVKQALQEEGLMPDTPAGKSGRKKSAGYPDIIFYFEDKPQYLECKTYNKRNINTTQRSFYLSPSKDFKVVHNAHHFILSYEIFLAGRKGGRGIYKCSYFRLLSIENLLVDVKHEFNSDNRRLYGESQGAKLLAFGKIK